MTDQPISPEVQELRDEQAQEAAHVAASRINLQRCQAAEAFRMEGQAHLLNAVSWLLGVATLLGAVVVVTEVIL